MSTDNNHPFTVELEARKTYFWCACGASKNQPFCDGSHKGSDITPVPFKVEDSKLYGLCGCKKSQKVQFCDGTHKTL